MSDDEKYYIRLRGREDGPYTLEDLSRLKSLGRFSTLHEVSTDRRKWSRANSLDLGGGNRRGSDAGRSDPPEKTYEEPVRPAEPPRENHPTSYDPPAERFPAERTTWGPPAPEPPRQPPAEEWCVSVDGQTDGPMPFEELAARLRSGQTPATALVWTARQGNWLPAQDTPEFANCIAAGGGPVIIGGYACAGAALLLFPPALGLAGMVFATANFANGRRTHAALQSATSIVGTFVGCWLGQIAAR